MNTLTFEHKKNNKGKAELWYFAGNSLIRSLPEIVGDLLIKNRSYFNIIFGN